MLHPNDIPDTIIRDWYKKKINFQDDEMGIPPIEGVDPPTILQIELTKNCNNACVMCHKGQVPAGEDFLRADIFDIALNQTRPIFPYLKKAMLFGDGEPMLYKHFWQLVSDIRKCSPMCVIDFINNGSLMNELGIKNCIDYKVSHLGLSMGGATSKTHNYIRRLSDFDKVVGNYGNLQEAKISNNTKEPYISALIVVMKSNVKEIPDFVELAASLGMLEVNCQQLFVTHSSMDEEVITSAVAEESFQKAYERAKLLGVGFNHYPLDSGNLHFAHADSSNIDLSDQFFSWHPRFVSNNYCLSEQPWNTVYVLHDGKVVPDCHWWQSSVKKHLNYCGTLDAQHDILDIWNGEAYQEIRSDIINGLVLPQCRGCGLAGGVRKRFRCAETDHISPKEELIVPCP